MTITHHFLASATAQPVVAPSERWLLAFPGGQWNNWGTLPGRLKAGDMVWVPVNHPDWLDKVTELVRSHPQCPVVVMSAVPYDSEGLRAINAGARGYCHLMAIPELMRDVAQVVQQGGLWVGPELVERIIAATRNLLDRSPNAPLPEADLSALSDRELEVAREVADGRSNKEVAAKLFISERTVKAHLGAIFEKLGVRDRVALVLLMSRQRARSA